VRTPEGAAVPFSTVATADLGRGFATITRVDRRRTINVTADVDDQTANTNEVTADLEAGFLPDLMAEYPGVRYSFEGQQRDQQESLDGLLRGFIVALFAIYALMAIPFKSYIQPLIVMTAIPFGIVGAIWGHALFGMPLSLLSLCGLVALTGIVVNDSLVLVSHVNAARDAGVPIVTAVHETGVVRFRPILLTSLTTAAGITPLMLEKSVQAQFLIPMAVALAFGVLFSTAITLVLVPAGYLILEDVQRFFRWMAGAQPDPALATAGYSSEGTSAEEEVLRWNGEDEKEDDRSPVGAGREVLRDRRDDGAGD
jgi:multidrug efflux pump subunit AcrB